MKNVLIVDDEEDILSSLHDLFQEYWPQVQPLLARSGAEGLKTMRNHPVDLIIADYRMDGMDGVEFLRQALLIAPLVPRIMMTAYPDAHLAVQARVDVQASLVVTKPFDVFTFGKLVGSLLGLSAPKAHGGA